MTVPAMFAVRPGRIVMPSGTIAVLEPAVLTFNWSTSPSPVTGVPVSSVRFRTTESLSIIRREPTASSSTVSLSTEAEATCSVEAGALFETVSRFPASVKLAPPSREMSSRPMPELVRSRMKASLRRETSPMRVSPSARRETYCPLMLSTFSESARVLNSTTLSPDWASPLPATTISPSTRTLSSSTPFRSRPPLM